MKWAVRNTRDSGMENQYQPEENIKRIKSNYCRKNDSNKKESLMYAHALVRRSLNINCANRQTTFKTAMGHENELESHFSHLVVK